MTQRIAALFVVGGGLVVQVMLTISGVISARLLAVEGRGELALVVAVSAMAAQLTLGGSLPNAVTRQLAARRLRARDGVGHLVKGWLVLSVVVATPFGVAFVFLHGGGGSVWPLALCVAALAVLNMAFRLVLAALLGESAPMGRIAVATLLPQTLVTVTLVVLFLLVDSSTPVQLCLVMIVAFTIGVLVSIALLAPTSDLGEPVTSGELWREARSTYVGSIGPIDGLALDRTLIGAIAGTIALGLYSAASALASLATMLGSGAAAVLLPRVAALRDDPVAERTLVLRWTLGAAGSLALLTALVALAAEPVIVVAFGQEFAAAVPVAYWLVPASGLLGLRRVLVAVLQGRGRGGVASWIELSLTPVLIVAISVAASVDRLEAVGAAMLVTAASSVAALTVAVVRTSPRRTVSAGAAGSTPTSV